MVAQSYVKIIWATLSWLQVAQLSYKEMWDFLYNLSENPSIGYHNLHSGH